MSDKWRKILYGVSGVTLGAIIIFCIYCFAVAIPEKREAERLAIEEARKEWDQNNAEASAQVTILPNVTGSVESDDTENKEQTGEKEQVGATWFAPLNLQR